LTPAGFRLTIDRRRTRGKREERAVEKLERYAPAAGIVFVVVVIVATIVQGSPPMIDDAPKEFGDYFADNDARIRWAQFINAMAVIPFLWWLGSLWPTLRRAEGGVPRLTVAATLGSVLAGTCVVIGSAVMSTAAFARLDPVSLKVFSTLSFTFFAAGAGGVATLVLASSVIILRSGALPAWIGWLGLLNGLVWIAAGLALVSTRDAVTFIGFPAFLLWLVWIIAVSLTMLRNPEPATV
jgi:hypothetical protein